MSGGTVISGLSTALNDGIGSDGDYYLTTDTNVFIGPKAAGTWTGVNELELSGGKFLTGAGTPGSSLGDVNDVYYDTVNGELYGPKPLINDWGTSTTQLTKPTVITGSGEPTMTTDGMVGDLYLDTDSKSLYEKVTSTEWDLVTNLAGNFTSGFTPPTPTTGREGDYYIDKTTLIFYGPKTGTVWLAIAKMSPITVATPVVKKSLLDQIFEYFESLGWANIILGAIVLAAIIAFIYALKYS